MGMRNCAEESCNALEFRETGYCQRHQSAMTSQIVIAKPKEIVLSLGTTTPSDNLLKWAGGLLAFGTLFILIGAIDWAGIFGCCGVLFAAAGLFVGGVHVLSRIFPPKSVTSVSDLLVWWERLELEPNQSSPPIA